ncbi:proline dehydrogenase 1, mitochondrial-like [Aplysia californica]|uniref:Proline dehydrogenase n=1 Tax=Aplysia californica TaxID=6500 RepID=A0ABM0JJ33_APLCA|nr:proline dehydrogenase 1, mitochondrial-like [Aplysia californica]
MATRRRSFIFMSLSSLTRCSGKDLFYLANTCHLNTLTTHQLLKDDLAQADKEGVCFGAKLVRGAYMVKERRLASEKGYPDPIQETFDMTCENYHRCLDLLLERAAEDAETVKFIIATHNEDTIHYAMNR